MASLRETFYPVLFLRLIIWLCGFIHPLSPPYPIPLPPTLPLILSLALCKHLTGPHRGQDTHSALRGTRTRRTLLFGNQGEAQADKPVGGRGTAAGWVLTEESGQAVPQSGPPRDGATNRLMALCILYINAALVSTPEDSLSGYHPRRLTFCLPLISLLCRVHHANCRAG